MYSTTLGAVFLAEIGDKRQLVVIGLSASSGKLWTVAVGAATGLVLVTVPAALLGGEITHGVPDQALRRGAAVVFVLVGFWMWFRP